MALDDYDPDKNIRTDLWSTMTASQLYRQQELMVNKISMLLDVANTVPAARDVLLALQIAQQDLTTIINNLEQHQKGY